MEQQQEQDDSVVAGLSESIRLVKKELDALEITVMSQKAPWYKNIPTAISVMALLFSFGTTYVSYKRTDAQDMQNMRAELRSLLQRLSTISRENVEVSKKYAGDPVAVGTLGSIMNQENALLSRQAAELARKLPKDSVSATEYEAIGEAMQNTYNLQGAKEFFGYAVESARDFNDKIAALRARANILFLMGQPEAGRNEYRNALNIFSAFSGYDDFTKATTNGWTEMAWAYSEATLGSKDQANQHLASAETDVSTLRPGPQTDLVKGQLNEARTRINASASPINSLTHP